MKSVNPKRLLYLLGLCLLLCFGSVTAIAQQITVQGKVVDAQDSPIMGATIKVIEQKGKGTISGADGSFRLIGVDKNVTLQVTFIGMQKQNVPLQGRTNLTIVLKEDAEQLGEVVVTALGIKRDRKALGYAIQEVKGDELVEARQNNVANALVGKISGLQVIKSSAGPGASAKITIRGNNSVTGLNQPLIVVDGVPIDNFTGAENSDYWNPSPDMGNGLADINPEDIASLTVLKGASAAALYGSRAGNGVILITTKSGHKTPGLGVTFSSSVAFETLFMRPQVQTTFGQGDKGDYSADSGSSWGPKIAGQEYTRWDGKTVPMKYFDNVSRYFRKPGVSIVNNISYQQELKGLSLYTSLSRTDDKSKIPGAELGRTNFTTRTFSAFGPEDKLSLDTKIQYIRTLAKNRPLSGNNNSNPFLAMYTMPITLDITDFAAGKDDNNKMIWWGKSSAINPYWGKDYLTNSDTRERFILTSTLKYQLTDWLSAELRAGMDRYYTEYESKTYGGSPLTPTGRYSFGQEKFFETNYSFLFNAHKDNLLGKWGGGATFGGNLMYQRLAGLKASVGELLVRDLFSVGNAKSKVDTNKPFHQKKINSLYGTAQLNYDGLFFLEGTLRTDWSSTLSAANRVFTYPSLSASVVVSDIIHNYAGELPWWFNYAKLRASVAQVGNDLNPYELYNIYKVDTDPAGAPVLSTNKTLYDEHVRSELITSYELGAEMRWLQNRLSLDIAWYRTNATRQLLNLPTDGMSGYEYKKINAGNIQNQGVELALTGYVIDTPNFGWTVTGNFAHNRNTIIALSPEIKESYKLGGYDNLEVVARIGGNYGEIYGSTFKRVDDPNSPYYNKLELDSNGLPTLGDQHKKIGDQQPDFTLGINNSWRYKGLSLSVQVDGQFGGQIFSASNHILQATGVAAVTAPGGERSPFVVDGVVKDANGNYQPNTIKVTPQDYWNRVTGQGNLGINEANIYSATNIRIRQLQLAYELPKDWLKKVYAQRLKLGFTVNNVLMLTSHLRGIDPESVFATGTNATGFEAYSAPTSRSYLFNVTLGF